jgi:16S rRNA (adenine1518-N6/adenine1519-N6)-dimethyltransferase
MPKLIKKLGQNFLTDLKVSELMISALNIKPKDVIFEIGPGGGALTHSILKNKDIFFTAVEYDPRFASELQERYASRENVRIFHDDVLQWFYKYVPQEPYKIIGSLPYYITSPIIHMVIKATKRPDVCIFMTQKEVAEKIVAQVPESSYLSIFVQTFFNAEILQIVSKEKFNPIPKVDSAVLKLSKIDSFVPDKLIRKYEGFLHKGYANPRKMLNKAFEPEVIKKVSIDPTLRPQNLSKAEWLKIFFLEEELQLRSKQM